MRIEGPDGKESLEIAAVELATEHDLPLGTLADDTCREQSITGILVWQRCARQDRSRVVAHFRQPRNRDQNALEMVIERPVVTVGAFQQSVQRLAVCCERIEGCARQKRLPADQGIERFGFDITRQRSAVASVQIDRLLNIEIFTTTGTIFWSSIRSAPAIK